MNNKAMNRIFILVFFVLSGVGLFGQNINRVEYFLDTDPGFGNGINVPITGAPALNDLTFSVPLGTVSDGFHTLFVRSRDANNRWSITHARPFVKLALPASVVNLNRIEYFVDTDPGFGNGTNIPFTAATSVTDLTFTVNVSGLTQGPHRLFVRSRDANNRWSIIQIRDFSVCNQAVPAGQAATSITTTGFTANWSAASGATSYRLDVSADNFATFIPGNNDRTITGATTASVTGLAPGTAYKYRVRAVNATCASVSSAPVDVTTFFTAPTSNPATSVSATGFQANWSSVSGAASYRLDVSADNFLTFVTGFNNKTVLGTSDIVTGLSPSTSYKYRVRAVSASSALSANSNEITVNTPAQPVAPVATAATGVSATGFTANWNAVTGATGYRLDVSADNFATFVTNFNDRAVTGTSQAVTGLVSGTAYKYRVRTTNANGTSVNSNVIDVTTTTPPAAPVATAATAVGNVSFTANWNAVSGATSYRLDVSADNFATFVSGFNNKTVTTTSDAVSGLTASTAYKYRVRSVNANGTSGNSNVIDVTTLATPPPPDAPVATAATSISQTGFTANWNLVTGATGYRLDVSADNFATFVTGFNNKTVSGTSDAVTGLTISTAYKYRVRSVNANGTSGNSNVIDVTTLAAPPPPDAPVATTATAVSQTGFTANWNAVSGATGYRLDVSADNFTTFITGFSDKTVTTTSDAVTGLTASTAYKYRVRAVNANGTSVNSNVIDVTTLAKQDQTITFAALPDRTVGDAAFALTATASSGLAVTFVSNSPRLTISGTQATIVSAGRVTVTASQAGNSVFNAAPAVERSFCIKPARPTITLGAPGETVVLTSSSATGNQWFRDGTLITNTSAGTLTVTQPGVYSLRVQVDDCQSEASANVPIIVTGDLTTANEHTWVYPNPVKDRVWVDLQSFEKGKSVQIRLVDLVGRVIQQAEAAGGSMHELNLTDQPAGAYRLVAKQSSRQLQMSLVKQ
jgi:hypothetical protein